VRSVISCPANGLLPNFLKLRRKQCDRRKWVSIVGSDENCSQTLLVVHQEC